MNEWPKAYKRSITHIDNQKLYWHESGKCENTYIFGKLKTHRQTYAYSLHIEKTSHL